MLACMKDYCPDLDLRFLDLGFGQSRRTPKEIDALACSLVEVVENIFKSMY